MSLLVKIKSLDGKQAKFSLFFITLLLCNVVYAQDDFNITSPISGVVDKLFVQPGQSVKKGEILLQFDTLLIDSELSVAKAKMTACRQNLSETEKEYERAKELYDRTVLSEHDLQKAKIDYLKVKAQYSQVNNLLVQAQWNKDHSKLVAPFSGIVEKVFSYDGYYVNNEMSAQPLLILKKSN